MKKPVALIIMDGFGESKNTDGNAIASSNTPNLDKIMNATASELVNLEEFGETMANSVVEFFKEDKNIKVVEKLKEYGLNTKAIESENDDINKVFEGMKIVLTGTLPTLKRNDAKEMIESRGGKSTSSVSKSTTFVLAGEEAGSKLTKANELGIKVIDEDTFIELCKLSSKEDWYIDNGNHTVPVIIYNYSSSIKAKTFDNLIGGQVDLMPTLLYLLGIPYDEYSQTALGRNLLNTDKSFAVITDGTIKGAENLSDDEISIYSKLLDISDKIIRSNYNPYSN